MMGEYLIQPHFVDRLPSRLMIIDDNRRTAVVHPADSNIISDIFSEEEMFKFLKENLQQKIPGYMTAM
ncbi:MAG: hypothetical protein ACLVIY_09340 [Anaerobutyricum soehngenii]